MVFYSSSYYLLNMQNYYSLILITFLIFTSCGEGLSPDLADEKSGFGGTITFSGEWNPNIKQTHIVAFKDPLISVNDFNFFNLKFVSDVIPNGTISYDYSTYDEGSLISTIEPGKISYIAVAQALKDTITLNREDWIVIGVYYENNDTANPGIIQISESEFKDNINIHCDFNNPPPQPPGGSKSWN